MVQTTNLGSSGFVRVIGEESKFSRMFVCFGEARDSFVHCKPFIGLDGCSLKGSYEVVLLTAMKLDANSEVLPSGVAIVDLEKKEMWMWFL